LLEALSAITAKHPDGPEPPPLARLRYQGLNDSGPKTRPSELFHRNCWISFERVEGSLAMLANYIGPHEIMWAADYPHKDGFFP
jgi:hypothetical protein